VHELSLVLGDSFFLPGFRARGFPVLPPVPCSLLDGKKGVSGSSPERPHGGSRVRPLL